MEFVLVEPDEIILQEMDKISARLFYEWAKEDKTLNEDNFSPDAKLKPFNPEPYVSNS